MTWYAIVLETDKAVSQHLEAIYDAFEKIAEMNGGDPELSVFELVEDDPEPPPRVLYISPKLSRLALVQLDQFGAQPCPAPVVGTRAIEPLVSLANSPDDCIAAIMRSIEAFPD